MDSAGPRQLLDRSRTHRDALLLLTATALLLAGVAFAIAGAEATAAGLWVAATGLGLIHSTFTIAVALRHRQPSVDIVAWLALVGALLVREPLAGAIIAVMLFTGGVLEARASARAERELSALATRAPRIARREDHDGVHEIPVAEVAVGDHLLVGTGEIVPVDGRLLEPTSFDESALSGEPMPVERHAGGDVRSGVVNAGRPARMIATETASRSAYTGVLRLVEQAQASTAPFVRLADRFAVAFVPLTLAVAGLAWFFSGDPVRAVAVLVVATPCPLLLAAPIAIMSGLSRASRHGVIVKGGAALEQLADGRVLLFDKTGTLTRGHPAISEVITAENTDGDDLLRLAASLDQSSAHVLAAAIVTAARDRGLALTPVSGVEEVPGYGLRGNVDGRDIRLGKATWIIGDHPIPAWLRRARRRAAADGSLTVFVAVDGRPAGVLLLTDPLRAEAPRMMRALRQAGIQRTVLISGDRADIAESVGRIVGIDAVYADRDPAEKLAIVQDEQSRAPTIMIGDGINDAPALAAAGAGVALAARGATASAEAADVVLTSDRVDGLADAILIARRSRRIARRAAGTGMGLSAAAMALAAAGLLTPTVGAVLQEVIDVAAIMMALAVLLPGRTHTVVLSEADRTAARRLFEQHNALIPQIEQIRAVADDLSATDTGLNRARELLDRLERDLLPHERAEEEQLLPIIARALGPDPVGALSRTHAEIEHQVRRLRRLLDDIRDRPEPEDLTDLRAGLYGLHAIMRLHNAQEEENAFSLL
ncbi:heavy metal translocating P-type ATPase [Glycomyces sp. NPDC049804]|uniref:heavy metal translocating P-type ATPase n=1 Tax=Glycomyces sp. NPDC049804 TaxID=3154363 RepID=UPI00343A3AD1